MTTLRSVIAAAMAVAAAFPSAPSAQGALDLDATPEGREAIAVWRAESHQFTPAVRQAFVAAARARTQAQLAGAGKPLPPDFLAWVDSDPVVQATVYGARSNAANVLLMLRSLELDLGGDVVRRDYAQLALAMAVVHAAEGPQASLSNRTRLQIVIPGDPRKPVDTTDAARPLDMNDHIINFLNSHTIEEEVVVGHKEEPPPLRYDERGVAIPPPKNAKNVKVPVTRKRTRSLYAADVMASRAWQEKFNACMKASGHDVNIDCGDRVIHWQSTAAVGAERKRIAEAFALFRTAYEEKGLLPKARDPFPTPAESMAWLIRNDRHVFPAATNLQRQWPRYPLAAPWPTLTLLAADNQPLREREERWAAFRDEGVMRTYGEYIGGIAQQFDMQSARRLSPFPFTYGTYQMMAKDGGVCGTMANMGVRTYNSLGIPACTAGQPGHCALIHFAFDPKNRLYECRGGQFATGGPDQTSPHTPWTFGDVDACKPMIYYQSIAWAVNHGLAGYLDSCLAFQFLRALPDAERTAHGTALCESALRLNPYNFLVIDDAQARATDALQQVRFWKSFQDAVARLGQPGCPQDKLFVQTVRDALFKQLAKLPVPADPGACRAVLALLEVESCRNAQAVVIYRRAVDGAEKLQADTASAFRSHLAAARTGDSCRFMADTLETVAETIPDQQSRQEWLLDRWRELQGRECYLDKSAIATDASMHVLARMTHQKAAAETVLLQPVLDRLHGDFAAHVAGARTQASSKQFAATINSVAQQLKDAAQRRTWLDALAAAIQGRETFTLPDNKPHIDPSAAAIAKLRESAAGS